MCFKLGFIAEFEIMNSSPNVILNEVKNLINCFEIPRRFTPRNDRCGKCKQHFKLGFVGMFSIVAKAFSLVEKVSDLSDG